MSHKGACPPNKTAAWRRKNSTGDYCAGKNPQMFVHGLGHPLRWLLRLAAPRANRRWKVWFVVGAGTQRPVGRGAPKKPSRIVPRPRGAVRAWHRPSAQAKLLWEGRRNVFLLPPPPPPHHFLFVTTTTTPPQPPTTTTSSPWQLGRNKTKTPPR
jgi:hypothetical protein